MMKTTDLWLLTVDFSRRAHFVFHVFHPALLPILIVASDNVACLTRKRPDSYAVQETLFFLFIFFETWICISSRVVED